MAADADGGFGGETFFASFRAAGVAQDAVFMGEDAVGDDLFVGGIVFCGGARQEEVVGRVEDGFEEGGGVVF